MPNLRLEAIIAIYGASTGRTVRLCRLHYVRFSAKVGIDGPLADKNPLRHLLLDNLGASSDGGRHTFKQIVAVGHGRVAGWRRCG